jgi:hypothetical protein
VVEKVCRSGGNGVPEWWEHILGRWKWCAEVVEMVCLNGGKMKNGLNFP